jgi:hypothetical protein
MKTKTHMQTNGVDREMLLAALTGYQIQVKRIEEKIEEVRRALGIRIANPVKNSINKKWNDPTSNPIADIKRQHRISAEGRARIASAQKKRWAKTRRERLIESMEGAVGKKKGKTGKKKVEVKAKAVKKTPTLAIA